MCQLTVILARQLKLRYFKWARDTITAATKAMLVIMIKYACVTVVADPLQHIDKKQQIWNINTLYSNLVKIIKLLLNVSIGNMYNRTTYYLCYVHPSFRLYKMCIIQLQHNFSCCILFRYSTVHRTSQPHNFSNNKLFHGSFKNQFLTY